MTNVVNFPAAEAQVPEAPMWEDVPEMRQPVIIIRSGYTETPAPVYWGHMVMNILLGTALGLTIVTMLGVMLAA